MATILGACKNSSPVFTLVNSSYEINSQAVLKLLDLTLALSPTIEAILCPRVRLPWSSTSTIEFHKAHAVLSKSL